MGPQGHQPGQPVSIGQLPPGTQIHMVNGAPHMMVQQPNGQYALVRVEGAAPVRRW